VDEVVDVVEVDVVEDVDVVAVAVVVN